MAIRSHTDIVEIGHYLDEALSPRQMRRLERKVKKSDKQTTKNSHVPDSVVKEFRRSNFQLLPKTQKQSEQLKALNTYDQVVCIGPAGTGKTYVTAAWAAMEFDKRRIHKIVLTRPNVPAGPSLGLFPGDMHEKFQNWVAPLTNVIKEVIGQGAFEIALKNGDIVFQPIETIRGASFANAVILVDEAQNIPEDQMKALVTRIGEGSKLVLDGDVNQKDIKESSGLEWALKTIQKSEYLNSHTGIVAFTSDDVVRSDLCKAWVKAIETSEKSKR